jgi:hypothetical protein
MATLNFNASEVKPAGTGYEPLPAGKYTAVIDSSEMKQNKAGTGSYLELKLQVVDGDYKGRTVFDRLNLSNPSQQTVEIAQSTLSAICHAVGVMSPGDSTELHNLPMTITVKCREWDGKILNEVKGYAAKGNNNQAPQQKAAPWKK